MTNGITYYKMKSPYVGDTTKNCALTGPEVDNNFFTLEGRDIKSISVEGNDIVLNLVNGEDLRARDAFDNFIVNVDFNNKDGVLKIYRNNGDIEELRGFTTSWNTQSGGLKNVATDATLKGNGLSSSPIGIANSFKTGQYKPVDEYISRRFNNISTSPKYDRPEIGARFIVEEQVSDYGLLYDYRTVMQIACDLQRTNSKWRIPTKEDWDDMLNAVEPNDCDRNHNVATPNKYLGEWAGKLLRSTSKWFEPHCGHHHHHDHHHPHPHMFNEEETPFVVDELCDNSFGDGCSTTYCGEPEMYHCHDDNFTKGIDKFGFKVMPSGYADDGGNSVFFGERGGFWTATNMKLANAYIKRFDYNKNTVYQDLIAGQNYYSLRLVKDYDGDDYYESEEILGQNYPTVLMPSVEHGKSVWTAINVYVNRKHYKTLVPNNGVGLTFTKKFFIDEWDGKKWLRNELNEGDSVVIKHAPHRQKDVEYRIIDGELVNTTTRIFEQVYDKVNVKFEEINKALGDEILRSVSKDNEHDEKIEKLEAFEEETKLKLEQLDNGLTEVNEQVDELGKLIETNKDGIEGLRKDVEDNKSEIEKTKQDLSDLIEKTDKAFDEVNSTISNEKDERLEADKKHDERLDKIEEKIANSVDWTDTATEANPERKSIVLANHDNLLGTATEDFGGGTYNLAMISKWNVADFGSDKLPLNLNSNKRPTVNDKEEIAYMSDLNGVADELKQEITTLATETSERFEKVETHVEEVSEQLNSKIDEVKTTLEEKIDTDINSLKDTISEKIDIVDGQLLVAEGTSYDEESGILTLKHKDDTTNEDIKVQFKFGNFGTF